METFLIRALQLIMSLSLLVLSLIHILLILSGLISWHVLCTL